MFLFYNTICLDDNVELKNLIDANGGVGMTSNQSAQLKEIYDLIVPSIDKRQFIKLGSGTSYNVSAYIGYKNFTVDNFIINIKSVTGTSRAQQVGAAWNYWPGTLTISAPFTKTYNASTGDFSISGTNASDSAVSKYSSSQHNTVFGTIATTFDVYLAI